MQHTALPATRSRRKELLDEERPRRWDRGHFLGEMDAINYHKAYPNGSSMKFLKGIMAKKNCHMGAAIDNLVQEVIELRMELSRRNQAILNMDRAMRDVMVHAAKIEGEGNG